ncbi:hypothetical protein OOJ91_34105 [Micromonospora lupini]|uniref:hypothetical protein n=1 Tax=Micromonospora lupini TaxID=285679 RepID=UPI002254548C|nr:hypothetical protein [Micromonospora lupini]MCX5070883.1 hypothetical protein [Micromonospora lupini]
MEIGEAMRLIAEEAERQGFLVRQTRTSMWHFRKGNDNWLVAAKEPAHVLEILRVLISAGLDWSFKD